MKLKEIETVDLWDGMATYWAALSDIPEIFQIRAKEIDGEKYNGNGFGVTVGYDLAQMRPFVFTDENKIEDVGRIRYVDDKYPAEGISRIFYTDKAGWRHWFRIGRDNELNKQIFDACARIIAGIDTPQGYTIQKTVKFDSGVGLVFAKKDDPTYPFSSWAFKETRQGYRYYTWSRCYADEKSAARAFENAFAVQSYDAHIVYFHTVETTVRRDGVKPSIREQLAVAKAAQAERPTVQRHQKDKEAR